METIFLLASHDKVLETILVARSLEDVKQSSGWCFSELMSDLGNLEAASHALPFRTALSSNPSMMMSLLRLKTLLPVKLQMLQEGKHTIRVSRVGRDCYLGG